MRSNQVPPSLQGVRGFLSQLASPALPTASTATLLRGNASNWLQVNLQILEQHYEDMVAGVRTSLLRPVDIDHHKAWLVALRWAVGKYKIDEEVVSIVMGDLIGVGLKINRIPEGSSLKAIMDMPAKRPRPKAHQRSKTTTPRTPVPSTSTSIHPQFDPDDQALTCTQMDLIDQPLTATTLDQDLHPTDQDPPPNPKPATQQDPPRKTTNLATSETSTVRPLRTTDPGPSTHTLPSPPPPNTDTDRPTEEPDGPTPYQRDHETTYDYHSPSTHYGDSTGDHYSGYKHRTASP